jgi:S1-C subfamily serine protease
MLCLAAKVVLGVSLGLLAYAEPLLSRAGAPWQDVAATLAGAVPFNRGTGFFVNARGDFVSALHVIDRCPRPALQTPEGILVGTVIASSKQLDIAVVATGHARGAYARFPDQPAQWLMEPVAIGRYRACGGPQSWSVTTATATSMFLFGRGSIALAASDPIEGGNSGSPVVDRSGAVVGMVFARLARMSETGIAIDATTITRFLGAAAVPYRTVPSVFFLVPESSGVGAAQYTFPVVCLI